MKQQITFDRFVRILGALLITAVIYFLLRRLSSVLTPFLVAWVVAYLLYPIVCFFQYKCRLRSRVLSIIATLLAVLAVLLLTAWLVVPPVMEECRKLSDVVVSYVQSNQAVTQLPQIIDEYVRPYLNLEYLSTYLTFNDVRILLEDQLPQVFSIISGSINAIIGFVASLISILYLFFILLDYEKLSHGFLKIVPTQHRQFVAGMLQDVENGMRGYFRGQALIALCVGILFAIGFSIIDFPLAIPLGLFIGFLNLVPYLQVVGFIPTIVLAILKAHDTGGSFWMILLAAFLVFAVVQTIQDVYLTPKIMGNVTGLKAAVILLSLSVWGSLLGFVGLIIALPLTSLLISYYRRYVLHEEDTLATPKENAT